MQLGGVREGYTEEEALCGMCRVLIALCISKRGTGEEEKEG